MYKAEQIVALAKLAGDKILDIYQRDFSIETKKDQSPLTEADLAAHRCIVAGLKQITPDIPVLSEESSEAELQGRQQWTKYWLIDPLDGTKEFIKRNGEFTVNIALIENGLPVFGVVYAPVPEVFYVGGASGAYKLDKGVKTDISTAKIPGLSDQWRIVGSRSHQSDEFKVFVKKFADTDVISMGSSLKLCLVAEGAADLYPRLGLTSEWDTAAAHAVVNAAGGKVLEYPSLKPLVYNSRPDTLLNPFFIVCADVDQIWADQKQS